MPDFPPIPDIPPIPPDPSKPEQGFHCTNCGAKIVYKPGTTHLVCEHCGTENHIQVREEQIEELDYSAFLSEVGGNSPTLQVETVQCNKCGAATTLEPHIDAANCPYCETPLVLKNKQQIEMIKPKSLLPFKINKQEALGHFSAWIKKGWFSPNDLKKDVLSLTHFKGIYIPYWTYDADTYSSYTGSRGEHYYETETYYENGQQKSRSVRKTRWYPASGQVNHFFDDVLVHATKSLPDKYVRKLEPWDLQNLVPFEPSFLGGFITERYQVKLEEGFITCKQIMDDHIRTLVRRDIGGDEQRIYTLHTQHNNITFKHILLPIYVSAFQYKGKLFQFLINARTGEVQGEKPLSKWKVGLAIAAGIVLIIIIYLLFESNQ